MYYKRVFMVSQSKASAEFIADTLSDHTKITRQGYNKIADVHEWKGTFQGEEAIFRMVSISKFIFNMVYQNFEYVKKNQDYFTQKIIKKPINFVSFLADESDWSDILILWMNWHRTGENICFEIMNAVSTTILEDVYSNIVTYRAKFFALEENLIKIAFNNLCVPNKNEALSVDVQRALNMATTAAFTQYFANFLNKIFLNTMQPPTKMCEFFILGAYARRYEEIRTFKRQTIYHIKLTIMNYKNEEMCLQWDNRQCLDIIFVKSVVDMANEHKNAILDCVEEEEIERRPAPLNTCSLVQAASTHLKIRPQETLRLAEKLYNKGYISFYKTQASSYPKYLNLVQLVQRQRNDTLSDEIEKILNCGINLEECEQDTNDPPPIVPLKCPSSKDLNDGCLKLHNYIKKGHKSTENINFGKAVLISNVEIQEQPSSPPQYYTESDMLSYVKTLGIKIFDDAVFLALDSLLDKNYITKRENDTIIPTKIGTVLFHSFEKIDRELLLPKVEVELDKELDQIALGMKESSTVLKKYLNIYNNRFSVLDKNDFVFKMLRGAFAEAQNADKRFSRCGKCKRFMRCMDLETSDPYLYCSNCYEVFKLPPKGKYNICNESFCDIDEFQMIRYSSGSLKYTFCPQCYNTSAIRVCQSCFSGLLVLSQPVKQRQKLSCSCCKLVAGYFPNFAKIKVLTDLCQCGARLIKMDNTEIKYNLAGVPLCFFCSSEINELVMWWE